MTTTTTARDVAHYAYRVTWSVADEEFVATCVELPSLSWLAASPEDALRGLRELVGARKVIRTGVARATRYQARA